METYDPKIERSICDWVSSLLGKSVNSFKDMMSGLIPFECLCQLDAQYFSTKGRDLFKNLNDLNEGQFLAAAANNWEVIYKAFQIFLENENYQDSYFELNIELITKGEISEYFGFFVSLISVLLIKKNYLWNQTLGNVTNSESYNYLKELEANLAMSPGDDQVGANSVDKFEQEQRDENQALAAMVAELQKSLTQETEAHTKLKQELTTKKDENEEIRKLLDQRTFECEKMRYKIEALEMSQKEYLEALTFKADHSKLRESLRNAEKKEEELEIENSFLRDKISEQDRKIKELKEIEAKFMVEQSLRQKFDMIVERNDLLIAEAKKKDLELTGLRYQVELLKKSKEALENVLNNAKSDQIKMEQQIYSLKEELKTKEQEVVNLDRIIVKMKENFDLSMMAPTSPVRKRTQDYSFKRPEDDEYVSQLETELEKLKAEKEVGWVDNDSLMKNNQEKEMLNQEIARLSENKKKLNGQLEELRKEKLEWAERESKYDKVCKNFKTTIAELKKQVANTELNKQITQTAESLFLEQSAIEQAYNLKLNVLESTCLDLITENQLLKEERLIRRNQPASYLLSSIKMFEEF